MKWEKLDFIFNSEKYIEGYTGAAVPFAEVIDDTYVKIYFTARDCDNRSNIFWVIIDIKKLQIISVSSRPILIPGNMGCFDDSGVMMSWLGDINGHKYLYYIGWNLGVTVPFRNSIGLAESKNGDEFVRVFEGPIVDRTKNEPHFCASNWILSEEGYYRMYYLSCTGWINNEGKITHKYHIKYAESKDGIEWVREGKVCIDFKDKNEYAISRPSVIKNHDKYYMWYSVRGEKYRIGYAESNDGIKWERKDELVGINVSENGFDSDMICYPCVFRYKNEFYMLYNGNGYGKTGFGIAKLVEKF